jgi:hypothetical protein
MRKLSKWEVRDYTRTLVPILESHEPEGQKDARVVDAIISYAYKGTKPWLRRASALQGFIGPRMSVLEGYLIFPVPGVGPVTIQSTTLQNSYLLLDIVGAGGGGGGGGGGNTTATTTYGQGGGAGGDGGRLIIRTQGPLPPGTTFFPQLGGVGGLGGGVGAVGLPGSPPYGYAQVVIGNGSLQITVEGATAPSMPSPSGGQQQGGPGGSGGTVEFTYLPTTPLFSVIQLDPRTYASMLAGMVLAQGMESASLNQGIGGNGIGSEYFFLSNTTPIFISMPQGIIVQGGNTPGGAGQSATANIPSGAIPLRGAGAGGAGGANSSTSPTAGGNGGSGGPGPIIMLVIG